jgi:NAD(P)-dependent dehydrogenase (short-subunit alcohol dehydrogenase family)
VPVVPVDDTSSRVAIVTGGARGIGHAIAAELLDDGWTVAVVDISAQAIASITSEPSALSGRLEATQLSIVDRPAVEGFVDDLLARHGAIDALVNNAGMTRPATFLDQNDEDWDRIVEVNLKGTFVMSQVVARRMVERSTGTIVNISSVSAHGVRTGPPAYAAAKAGVEGLSRLMAVQLGGAGVRVNTVVVGTTATRWLRSRKSDRDLEEMRSTTLTGRIGDPEDVAAVVSFLCSSASRHVTGQLISVSGGQWVP